jgi:hypothetical protein
MPIFKIRGTTLYGKKVEESIEAVSEALALSVVYHKHGKLRKKYDIYEENEISDYGDIPDAKPNAILLPSMSESEIIQIAERICSNESSNEEFKDYNYILIR